MVPKRPVLKCIRFDVSNNWIVIAGTNLDQYATYYPERNIVETGVCVVELEKLKPFTKGSDADVLTLEAKGASGAARMGHGASGV